jgi:serine/threonine-protein kinase
MYVAPEALSGEMVTPNADQYSLATIGYFLLTGALPYLAKSPREMFTQLLSQPPIPLNKARANLDFGPRVEHVVMKGLSRQPGDRYSDILTFATELRDALVATPTDEPGLLSRVRGLFRR